MNLFHYWLDNTWYFGMRVSYSLKLKVSRIMKHNLSKQKHKMTQNYNAKLKGDRTYKY